MSYVLPLFLAIMLNTVDKLLTRESLRRIPAPDTYLLVYQLVCFLVSLPAAAMSVANGTAVQAPAAEAPGVMAALVVSSMLAWAGFAISTFRSAATLEVSVSATIGRTKLLWTALLGVLLFDETLSSLHIAGLTVIFLANLSLWRVPLKLLNPAGIFYAVLAAACLSLAMAFDKWLLRFFDPSVVLLIGFAGATSASICLNGNLSFADVRPVLSSAILAAICGTAGYFFLLLAMDDGPLNVVVPVYQSAHIVHVAAGILILREYGGISTKLISAVVSAFGIALIFIGSA
jgi:drug/metabolite transporter (DMT)-like permease